MNNPETRQLLELAGKDFKVVSITMLIMNKMLRNFKRQTRSKKKNSVTEKYNIWNYHYAKRDLKQIGSNRGEKNLCTWKQINQNYPIWRTKRKKRLLKEKKNRSYRICVTTFKCLTCLFKLISRENNEIDINFFLSGGQNFPKFSEQKIYRF